MRTRAAWGYGATVARLTPDQKVGSSNLSALTFAVTRIKRRAKRRKSHRAIGKIFYHVFLLTVLSRWGFASVSISVELGVEVRWGTACSVDHVDGSP